MKKYYSIGFFLVVLLLIAGMSFGYQLSYRRLLDRQETQREEQKEEQAITTKGKAEKNEGYYLKELNGYVTVYLSDKKTIYELTEIPLTDLPEEIQQEVCSGKYIESIKELYAFLENYSS